MCVAVPASAGMTDDCWRILLGSQPCGTGVGTCTGQCRVSASQTCRNQGCSTPVPPLTLPHMPSTRLPLCRLVHSNLSAGLFCQLCLLHTLKVQNLYISRMRLHQPSARCGTTALSSPYHHACAPVTLLPTCFRVGFPLALQMSSAAASLAGSTLDILAVQQLLAAHHPGRDGILHYRLTAQEHLKKAT